MALGRAGGRAVFHQNGVLPDALDLAPTDNGVLIPAQQAKKAAAAVDDDGGDPGGAGINSTSETQPMQLPLLMFTTSLSRRSLSLHSIWHRLLLLLSYAARARPSTGHKIPAGAWRPGLFRVILSLIYNEKQK